MASSARLFLCARCRCQVVICSHCDRGNIYCGKRCAQAARHQSQRAAARRYQNTRRGRQAHAERQRRYRRRRAQKVTHQGSPPPVADETLPGDCGASARAPTRSAQAAPPPAVAHDQSVRCRFCARVCSPFLRQRFLHRGSVERTKASVLACSRSP